MLWYKSHARELHKIPDENLYILTKKGEQNYGSKENSSYKDSSSTDRRNR